MSQYWSPHWPPHGPHHGHGPPQGPPHGQGTPQGPPHGQGPPQGPPPPYAGAPYWPHDPYPCPPPDGGQVTAPQPYPYYIPGAVMIPVAHMPMPQPDSTNQPTYITNIYHGETSNQPSLEDSKPVELSGEFDWVPTTSTTAAHLTGRAVVGGHEGWDGSALWVIRAWHQGDLIPGKFSVRHNAASIVYDGKEIPVQNMEVLICRPEGLRWLPASNGNVPPGAIPGGRTVTGETLYVARARHQLSITPGKLHPSHKSCYIAFAGSEVAHKTYDVLCRIS